ncbi:hypothetical protein KY285_008848 [Solanum tuberosum]|nr:hypothetical protein KY284_008886 [Solanum tuberosum]KAH0747191.1 hypothetical protein KY285_008848 [Solanum tuberosum]
MVDSSTDSIPNASASTVRVEILSPFYLHPSENASSSLLPAVFDGTGYRSWRRAVLRALSVKSKTKSINGKVMRHDPSFQQWEMCDDMATSWILNSLSLDLHDSLHFKRSSDLVQGTLDITGYYTKMKKLWEEMNTVDIISQCNCVCTCGGKTKLVKAEQDRRLIHFQMGLNEMHTVVRGNFFMMNTLPSMAQDFAILSQEEKQKEVKPHNYTALDSTSLNVFASSNNVAGSKGPKTNFNSNRGNTGGYGNSNTNVFRGNSSTGRSSLFCDFCKKTGHTKDRCYKLHGYPTNSKFSKGKSSNSAANVCASEVDRNQCEDDNELSKQMPLNLSKGQYEQLLNLLGSLHANHGTNNSENMLSGPVNLGPSLKSPLELGRAKNDLYFLCSICHNCHPPSAGSKETHVTAKFFPSHSNCSPAETYTDEFLWHARLGHPFTCVICPMARQTRIPFPESTTSTTKAFELLHIDLWGPYHIPTHDGYNYFLTMVDDNTRSTWT